jgi:hypothetical protein
LTETATKGHRYATDQSAVSKALDAHAGRCSVYEKKEMAVPQDLALPRRITDCDDLTRENIRLLCEGEVHDYCAGNYVLADELKRQGQAQQQQQQQQKSEGMCTLTTVGTLDTCKAYR